MNVYDLLHKKNLGHSLNLPAENRVHEASWMDLMNRATREPTRPGRKQPPTQHKLTLPKSKPRNHAKWFTLPDWGLIELTGHWLDRQEERRDSDEESLETITRIFNKNADKIAELPINMVFGLRAPHRQTFVMTKHIDGHGREHFVGITILPKDKPIPTDLVRVFAEAESDGSDHDWASAALALEDYANQHISQEDPAFGDFMYHAELLRKGHEDIHREDLETIAGSHAAMIRDIVADALKPQLGETWSNKYKKSINCAHPKGFSQKAHCAARRKRARGGKTKSRPVRESTELIEAKKKRAKTLIDGMIKTLIARGRTQDEAVADLKKQIDARFYEAIDAFVADEILEENLRDWFKQKWVRFGPDGKIRGACARGSDSEGKPKCLPQSKAHALGKKGRAKAARRKRREDPNPERHGKAKNVRTKESMIEDMQLSAATVRRLQAHLNSEYDANLDVDGVLGPLTAASIRKFMSSAAKAGAPDPSKTTAVQGSKLKSDLDEKCWDGYRKQGMKTLFGKRVPNCVKAEETVSETCPHCGGEMVSEDQLSEKKDACYYKVKSRYKVWPSAYASGALVQCRKKGAKNWGKGKAEENLVFEREDQDKIADAVIRFYRDNTKLNPPEDYAAAARELIKAAEPSLRDKVKHILIKAKANPYLQGGVITTIGALLAGKVLGIGAQYGLSPYQTNLMLQGVLNTVIPTLVSKINGRDWKETIKYTLASAGTGIGIAAMGGLEEDEEGAVHDLMGDLGKHRKKLAPLSVDDRYERINDIMQRISKANGVTAKQLHKAWIDRYGELPDEWVLDEQQDTKIKLYTDPHHFGAEVDDSAGAGIPVTDLRLDKLVGFEPDIKMKIPKSAAKMVRMVELIKAGKGDQLPPILVRRYKDGYQVLDGHHRFHAYQAAGAKTIPAKLIPDEDIAVITNENFADGKGPGRPGDSQRHGIPKGATMAQLQKAAKAPGRKGQLARWQINMRRGRKKS